MSMNKKVLGGLVVGLVTLVLAASSLAAGPGGGGTTPTPTVTASGPQGPAPKVNPCPTGWHLTPNTKTASGAYSCTPTKTMKMIECPSGMEYFDDGCSIGCQAIVK